MSNIKSVSLKLLAALALLMILFQTDSISQVRKLTLDEAIKTALENNSDTRIAVMEVNKARAAVREAYGYALPSVGVSANFSHFLEKPMMAFPDFGALLVNSANQYLYDNKFTFQKTDGSIAPMTFEEYEKNKVPMETVLQSFALSNNYEAKVEVQQILFNSAVFTGIGASAKYLQTSEEMLHSKVSKTVLQVKKAFYGIVLAKEAVSIAKLSLENFENHLSNVRALYNGGLAAEYNVLQAEVQVENFKPVVLDTENGLKNATEGLKMLLKIDKDTEIDVDGNLIYQEISVANANELIAEANKKNKDIKTLESKIEVDEAFVDLDRSDWWPSVAAFGNYSINGSSDDFNFMNYRQSMVGVAITMNLFNGNRTTNKVQQSSIERMKTEEQLSQLKNLITLQIKTKLNELDRVRQNLIAADRNIELAEKTAKIANVGFSNGTRTQLEILTAETQLRQAKTNRMQSVYAYIVTLSEIDELVGNINPEYIKMVLKNENNK
ncbi:MAG: TolC family protein [Candidatus Kapabacteria bacterium]|nr:TolC family protein [Candidatus Kapabacteria bacterium]